MMCRYLFHIPLLLFYHHLQSNHEMDVLLLESIFYWFSTTTLAFILSEFGQRICDAYDEINDAINQTEWYLLPIEMQRMLPIIMMNAQQSLELNFFGSFSCNREQFQRVSGPENIQITVKRCQ